MRFLILTGVFAFTLWGQRPIPVKVAAGDAAMVKRNPVGLRESFAVTGNAGQTLLVELNIGEPDAGQGDDKIQVAGPGGAKVESQLGEDTRYNWMHALPQTGTYTVTVARAAKKPYVLRFSLMEAHDPRIDVGISAGRISIPALGKDIKWKRDEFFPVVMELADPGPDRLSATVGQVEIAVMAVEGIKKTWWLGDDGAKRVAKLEAALKSGVVTGSPQQFPSGASEQAELVFFANRQVIQGPGLRAVRWVGAYDQTGAGPVNPLAYAAEGITPDGKYFVSFRGIVAHPAVPEKDPDLEGDRQKTFRDQLARKLDAAAETSFTPNRGKLDEMVRGFAIR